MSLALPLRTGRLSLRAALPGDAPVVERVGLRRRRDGHLLIVEDRTTGRVLGACGLQPLAHGDETELVLGVLEAQRGRRVATEAGSILLEAAFRALALPRVVAVVDPEEPAGARVLEKLGFRCEAVYRDGAADRDLDYLARGPHLPTPKPRYRIRRARLAECDVLGAIEEAADVRFEGTAVGTAELFDGPPASPAAFREGLASHALWVAADRDDKPVGFALLERLGDVVHLDELDVLPDHGQQGLGARLLHAVLAQAHEEGARGVTLTTFREIAWNAPFYARHGFAELAQADWPPGVAERVASEAARGMRPADRLVMRRAFR